MITVQVPKKSSRQAEAEAAVQTSAHPAPVAQGPVFCKNCKHIRHADKAAPFYTAVISHVSLVHGPRHEYCQVARDEMGECGVAGRLFEAKQTRTPYAIAVRAGNFTNDHLIAIELALEERIEFLKRQIGYNPDDGHWADSLDVAHQALELVQ